VDALDNAASLDRDHLAEQLLDAFGCAPSQVAFTTFGAYHHARPGDPEALGSRLVGLQFVLIGCLLARHVRYSFSHKTPCGWQSAKPGQVRRLDPRDYFFDFMNLVYFFSPEMGPGP
jgi:hypothetical protein